MIDFENKSRFTFTDLVEIMSFLRGPEGCPWDREQTHKSIRHNLLEEAQELADAIDKDDPEEMLEELGDVLLQVIFHADIARDEGRFTLEDIADATCKKLIRRHLHVFKGVRVNGADEVPDVWDDVKSIEKAMIAQGRKLRDMTINEIEELYKKSKVN